MKDIEIEYRDYAAAFWKILTSTFCSESKFTEYLPIIFESNTENSTNETTNGVTFFHTNSRTGVATIYPVIYLREGRFKDEIKRTIRHETIHYFLGIHYRCHNDDSALFWIISDLFDGGAYKPLLQDSDDIYNTAIPFFKSAYQFYQQNHKSTVATNLALMLTAVDEAESSANPDVEQLRLSLYVCLDAAKNL